MKVGSTDERGEGAVEKPLGAQARGRSKSSNTKTSRKQDKRAQPKDLLAKKEIQELSNADLDKWILALTLERELRGVSGLPQRRALRDKVLLYDLETTGLGKTRDVGIVEIGCILAGYTDAGWIAEKQFHSLICAKGSVSNGKGGRPTFAEIQPALETFFREAKESSKTLTIAAHNGKRYDHRIMFFHGFKPPVGVPWGDSMNWIKRKHPVLDGYSIKKLYPGGSPPAAHHALPDCEAVIVIMNHHKIEPKDVKGESWNAISARCTPKNEPS